MRFDAIIFDFDGTLIDTMPMHYEAYRRTFAELDLELTRDAFFNNIGGNAREAIPKLLGGRPCSASIEAIHTRKKELIRGIFSSAPLNILETAKLLPLLFGKLPLALASSGSREGIQVLLDRLDWQQFFAVVLTGEDTMQGKPAPDVFLLAAEHLGVPAPRCFVFEDTDAGVQAARRAGMEVFDVRATTAADHQAGRSQ
jgi:beta-phosphoglucomutase